MQNSDGLTTTEVLLIATKYAEENGIDDVVVASTGGETGIKAVDHFDPDEFNVVVVGHSTGFGKTNEQELSEDAVERIEKAGGKVFVGPMIFHNINSAIGDKEGYSSGNLVANTLRLFGQGTKVALECVLMATDAGLIGSGRSVLSIAGTGDGADTALLIHSANSKNFFDSRVQEVVVKPREVRNLIFY